MVEFQTLQRIVRLAPLGDVLAWLDERVKPVAPCEAETANAAGTVLAADVVAPRDMPGAAAALRDGWAVASDLVLDASSYTPIVLTPSPRWVETGAPMPPGTDAVLPADAIVTTKAGTEAHVPATPGEGVMPAGANAVRGAILRRAGTPLRPSDVAVLRTAGIGSVAVRRPRVRIFSVTVPALSAEDAIAPMLARAIEAEGGRTDIAQAGSLEDALADAGGDAIITIGGTGTGKRDAAVATLQRTGKVAWHGVGLSPGETTAIGTVEHRPVLMLPGRLDAALASFLVLGRALLARLTDRSGADPATAGALTRKIVSTVGLAQVVLVRQTAEGMEPLGTEGFGLLALAQADGWVLVPPESEGYAAGARVEVRRLP